MRIGTGPGPSGAFEHQATHYVYDSRSGAIVAVYHFAGASPKSNAEQREAILKGSHESTGIPLEHLAFLTNPDVPSGEGELRVHHQTQRLVRVEGVPGHHVRT
jgi:hypothetical protein